MPIVVGVKFDKNPKVYHFDPAEETLVAGDLVVVDTQKGNELGEVVKGNFDTPELPDDFVCPLCKHGAADFDRLNEHKNYRAVR